MGRITRARALRITAVALCLALAAGRPFAWASDEIEQASDAQADLPYDVRIQIEAETEELRAAVTASSLLVSLKEEPLDSVGALFERARKDEQRVRKALNALGYFGATVRTEIGGKAAADPETQTAMAAAPPAGTIDVALVIVPGSRFALRDIGLVLAAGAVPEALEGLRPDTIGLRAGDPARSAIIADADRRLVAILREKGFPRARVVRRDAVADHAAAALDVTLVVEPGQKGTFGRIVVKGTERVNPDFVARVAPFSAGEEFRASLLADFRQEIERLNVFDSLVFSETVERDGETRIELAVDVHERPRRVIGAAASLSTLEGGALAAYWEHRNLFGEAERLRVEATSSRLFMNGTEDYEYSLAGALTIPAWPTRRDDVVFRTEAKRERPDAYARDALEAGAAWKHRFDKTMSVEAGVTLARSREEDAFGEQDRMTLALPLSFLLDTRNDALEPVSGWKASAELRPMMDLRGAVRASVRMLGQVSLYLRLDDEARTVLAGRLAAGLTLGSDTANLPVDQRFFAGGGGSVRGYAYQSLSPRDPLGNLVGGASLVETGLELRHWLWDDIGIAVFADAGGAFEERYPDIAGTGTAVGVGGRYRTPLGPVRFDLALPLDRGPSDPEFAVYIGLGQAF